MIAENQAENPQEAEVWIEDLKRHDRDYYDNRLAAHRKQVRDQIALGGEALKTLHQSALDSLYRMRDRGVTKCLVGTRGLLGEGWDAHKVNVLVSVGRNCGACLRGVVYFVHPTSFHRHRCGRAHRLGP
ncbi:MAG: hypothetical protein ABIK89_13920 [Planctomycetota bacterium]